MARYVTAIEDTRTGLVDREECDAAIRIAFDGEVVGLTSVGEMTVDRIADAASELGIIARQMEVEERFEGRCAFARLVARCFLRGMCDDDSAAQLFADVVEQEMAEGAR